MRPLLVLGFFASACSTETYAVAQPRFPTRQAESAFERAVRSVGEHCGGVQSHNPEARAVIGAWQAWPTADGVTLAQCLVTIFPDESGSPALGDVRVTFSLRKCPASEPSDFDALALSCPRTEVVSQQVSEALRTIAEHLEADIRR